MILEQALHAYLLADADVAAKVGTRIKELVRTGQTPEILIERPAGVPYQTLSGPIGGETILHISVFGKTISETRDTAKKLKRALAPFTKQAQSLGGIHVQVNLEDEFSLFNAADAEQMSAFHFMQIYRFTHEDEEN